MSYFETSFVLFVSNIRTKIKNTFFYLVRVLGLFFIFRCVILRYTTMQPRAFPSSAEIIHIYIFLYYLYALLGKISQLTRLASVARKNDVSKSFDKSLFNFRSPDRLVPRRSRQSYVRSLIVIVLIGIRS